MGGGGAYVSGSNYGDFGSAHDAPP